MNIEEFWQRALKHTEIVRSRVQALMTFGETRVPYIFLAESSINEGDTVVRKGEIMVAKPSLYLPPNLPQFYGFEFEQKEGMSENNLINFLIVRGITLPSLKYNNTTHSLDIFEDKLSKAIAHYEDLLKREENVLTGLITGPEDCWQFSVLIFVCSQIAKNLDIDIRKLLEKYKKSGP